MQGLLVENIEDPSKLQAGEYCKWQDVWYVMTPNGILGTLKGHKVTENIDATISVFPSILCKHWNKRTYHGYLENGIWKEC